MSAPKNPKIEDLSFWFVVPFSIIAPTWCLADRLKRKSDRTKTIKGLNWFWLAASVFSFFGLCILKGNDVGCVQWSSGWLLNHPFDKASLLLWGYLLWSRNTEIGFAFLRDAYDKTGLPISRSKLRPRDRLVLAFKSYIELICNFSMLFALCPAKLWQQNAAPKHITDVLYFSATTITTSGNGALIPTGGLLQFLSTYEIYCGLILLVVCFTIYTGMKTPCERDSP